MIMLLSKVAILYGTLGRIQDSYIKCMLVTVLKMKTVFKFLE